MKGQTKWLIVFFGAFKLILHFISNTNYGLHRDEYLYFDQGQHLGWGFMEVPPFTPFIASITNILGGSIFVIRLFPALIGAITIVLATYLVKKLGGGIWAMVITGFSLIFTPALLGSNSLFQPVSFNQFFWFISAFFLILAINEHKPVYWYGLGISLGLGILNKYSIAVYALAMTLAILMTPARNILKTKFPYIALGIALIIALPNIIWQFNHNLPVVTHMKELSRAQLVNVDLIQFLSSQFLFHFSFSFVWISGVVSAFTLDRIKPFRYLVLAFLLTILIFGLLHGKAYYTIGSYTILFVLGGISLDFYLKKTRYKFLGLAALILFSIPTLPYTLPILKINAMKNYAAFMANHIGLSMPLRWEDGKYYALPQDYADMNGWEELCQNVARLYHSLTPEQKAVTMIYGGSYGHAGAINYFRKKYALPEAYSLNGSYMMWVPTNLNFENQIMVEEAPVLSSEWYNTMILKDTISNPYAREKGYTYYRQNPKVNVAAAWAAWVSERKQVYNFK